MSNSSENLALFPGLSNPALGNPFYYESLALRDGFQKIAGVDEVGRGPLAGPVVAAAVILPGRLDPKWAEKIKDSKQMSPRAREEVFGWIIRHAEAFSVGVVSREEIDRGNILAASLEAMRRAVKTLEPPPDYLLVDGLHSVPLNIPQRCLKKGDQKSKSISAASVVAKVYRDRIMKAFHEMYPCYHFDKNKGYGTRQHLQALHLYGPCPIHRHSFKGVGGK